MAVINSFSDFFSVDNVDLSAYITNVEITARQNEFISTSGAADFVSRIPTTKEYLLVATLAYDNSAVSVLTAALKPGLHTVIWGPEGNAPGKPRHAQAFLFQESSIAGGSAQRNQLRVMPITAASSGAPTADIHNGGVFPTP